MRYSTLLTLCMSSCALADSIRWTLNNVGPYSNWNDLIKPCLNMLEDLAENNVVTILVPTNEAVDQFKSSPEFAAMNRDKLCDLVQYHLIEGIFKTKDFGYTPFLKTMLRKTPTSAGVGIQVDKVSDAELGRGVNFYSGLRRKSTIWLGDYVEVDITVFHAIDRVLTPPLSMAETALGAGLTSAIAAATKTNLDWWTDDGATYFMPTNEAFRAVGNIMSVASDDKLRNILTYHYVNGTNIPLYTSEMIEANHTTADGEDVLLSQSDDKTLFVNMAAINSANILVENGVMHIIDQVLNPNNPDSRVPPSGPFSISAFPNAAASGNAPFAGLITQHSNYHLEAGQPKGRIQVGPVEDTKIGVLHEDIPQ